MSRRRRRRSGYRGAWNGYGWYPPAPPKRPPPAHGIKVKKIGTTWWGQRWIEALEKLSWEYANRLTRGRTYARAGRVHDLEIVAGKVSARVTGSRPTPYTVTVHLRGLPATAWAKALAAMAKEAIFAAQLLAGEMPKDIDGAFRAAGVSLFPVKRGDLKTECSCPDWANPCKHIAATHYVLGEAFDRDPFLLFEFRGRTRERVLGALRQLRAGTSAGTGTTDLAASNAAAIAGVSLDKAAAEGFERFRAPLKPLRFRIEAPVVPAVVLRQLGAPPSWSLHESPAEALGAAYEAGSTLARRLALAGDNSL
jgi:uncharacterized Zn finger protein